MDRLTVLTPLLIVVVRALRAIPALKARAWLLPFVAAGCGVVLAYADSGGELSGEVFLRGLVAGFAASGLYDAGKGTKEQIEQRLEGEGD